MGKTTRRTSVKRLTVSAAALLASSMAAAAFGQTITVAIGAAFSTLDPYDCPDVLTRAVAKSVYEGLFTFDKKMNVVAQLAEGYSVSPDGRRYTVTLKSGVKFHDGEDFNAAAVKANFDRFLDPKLRLNRYSAYSNIDKVDIVDPQTVRFELKTVMPGFVSRLAATTPQMICPKALEQYGRNHGLATRACGTGPYKFVSYSPTEGLVVERNPSYRVKGLPKLDGIRFVPVVENSTRSAMLRTGEAQYATPLPAEQMKILGAEPDLVIETKPSLMARYLAMNVRVKPFSDKRVREAINYAINKNALIKVAYSGFAVPADGLFPPELPANLKQGPWPYDPQKAKALLKEAGYPNGFETTLWSGYNNTTASKAVQFLSQQLAQVGIRTKTRLLEPGVRTSEVYAVKDPDASKVRLYYIGWADSTMDPDLTLRPILGTKEAPPKFMNAGYYSNPAFDALLDKALAEPDAAKRKAVYDEAQRIAWNDAPWAFLLYEVNTAGMDKRLKNFHLRADGAFDFYEAELAP